MVIHRVRCKCGFVISGLLPTAVAAAMDDHSRWHEVPKLEVPHAVGSKVGAAKADVERESTRRAATSTHRGQAWCN